MAEERRKSLTRHPSLLTEGLESLRSRSPAITKMLVELYKLDDDLQEAHALAKQDDEFGEEVVGKYEEFLAHREALVSLLQREGVPVPWQLMLKIDDIELTRRQRREKEQGTAQPVKKTRAKASETESSSDEVVEVTTESTSGLGAAPVVAALLALLLAFLWLQRESQLGNSE